ncbi:MAG: dihydroorotase [Clostridiales bacterium]|nr:dihydroorotase [Clostridiales bacterium]
MRTIIKNGTLVNPMGESGRLDVAICDGVIEAVAENICPKEGDRVIDAEGKLVFPGFVDMHCHLRDPGLEYKEDLYSGTRSAVMGGFTSVACMPNTDPVLDQPGLIRDLIARNRELGYAKVYPIASVTKGQKGKEITEFGMLKESGAAAFSDDGRPVMSSLVMKNALNYAKNFDALIIAHEEDLELLDDGVMNKGESSMICGLKGIPSSAEEVMIIRDIILARELGAKVHIAHVSTELGVELVRFGKSIGANVTAETCPQYFSLTDKLLMDYDTNAKINPPLRSEKDVAAIIEGLKDGTLDAIVTDHAPHHVDDKAVEFGLAMNGMSGFETALPLIQKNLVEAGHLSWDDVVTAMSVKPAELLKAEAGVVKEGASADVVVYDPAYTWVVTPQRLYTKGKNTPLMGWELQGRVAYAFTDGKLNVEEYEVAR